MMPIGDSNAPAFSNDWLFICQPMKCIARGTEISLHTKEYIKDLYIKDLYSIVLYKSLNISISQHQRRSILCSPHDGQHTASFKQYFHMVFQILCFQSIVPGKGVAYINKEAVKPMIQSG